MELLRARSLSNGAHRRKRGRPHPHPRPLLLVLWPRGPAGDSSCSAPVGLTDARTRRFSLFVCQRSIDRQMKFVTGVRARLVEGSKITLGDGSVSERNLAKPKSPGNFLRLRQSTQFSLRKGRWATVVSEKDDWPGRNAKLPASLNINPTIGTEELVRPSKLVGGFLPK